MTMLVMAMLAPLRSSQPSASSLTGQPRGGLGRPPICVNVPDAMVALYCPSLALGKIALLRSWRSRPQMPHFYRTSAHLWTLAGVHQLHGVLMGL